MTIRRFHVYVWRLLIFRWILYKGDISIKRTLLSCTNGVHFIEIPLSHLKRHIKFNQRYYSTHYQFLFSKFLKYRNWWGEGEFLPKRTYLGRGGAQKRTRANKWRRRGSKLGKLERTYFSNVPLWNLTRFTFLVQKNSLWSEIPLSIISDWKVFSVEFVRIWSIRGETLHGTRVGDLINCFKEWIWQNSFYIYLS